MYLNFNYESNEIKKIKIHTLKTNRTNFIRRILVFPYTLIQQSYKYFFTTNTTNQRIISNKTDRIAAIYYDCIEIYSHLDSNFKKQIILQTSFESITCINLSQDGIFFCFCDYTHLYIINIDTIAEIIKLDELYKTNLPIKTPTHIYILNIENSNQYNILLFNQSEYSSSILTNENDIYICKHVSPSIPIGFKLSFTRFIDQNLFVICGTANKFKCILNRFKISLYKYSNYTLTLSECGCKYESEHLLHLTSKTSKILQIDDRYLTLQHNKHIYRINLMNCLDFECFQISFDLTLKSLTWLTPTSCFLLQSSTLYLFELKSNPIYSRVIYENVLEVSSIYQNNFYYFSETSTEYYLMYAIFISNEDHCKKLIDSGKTDEAMFFCEKNKIHTDLVYKHLWTTSAKTYSDTKHLLPLTDFIFALRAYLEIQTSDTFEREDIINICNDYVDNKRECVSFLLEVKRYHQRHLLFNGFSLTNTHPDFYYYFRTGSIFKTCLEFLTMGLFTEAASLFDHYSSLLTPHRLSMLKHIPEPSLVSKYYHLLPFVDDNKISYRTSSTILFDFNQAFVVEDLELREIEDYYRKYPSDIEFSAFKSVDISQWYIKRAFSIDQQSGCTENAYNILLTARSLDVEFEEKFIDEVDFVYKLIYFYNIDVSLDFIPLSIDVKFKLLLSQPINTLKSLLELFFTKYTYNQCDELKDVWKCVPSEVLMILVKYYKSFNVSPNYVVSIVHSHLIGTQDTPMELLNSLTRYIGLGTLNTDAANIYQHISVLLRIIHAIKKLELTTTFSPLYIDLYSSKNINIFQQIFEHCNFNWYKDHILTLHDFISCILILNQELSTDIIIRLFQNSIISCEYINDLETILNFLSDIFSSDQRLSHDSFYSALVIETERRMSKSQRFLDDPYHMSLTVFKYVKLSNENTHVISTKFSIFESLHKISNISPARFFSKLTPEKLVYELIINTTTPESSITQFGNIMTLLFKMPPIQAEIYVLELLVTFYFNQKAHIKSIEICNRLRTLNHPDVSYYFYQISSYATSLPLTRRLSLAYASLETCPHHKISSILDLIRDLRKLMIAEKNGFPADSKLYYPIESNEFLHDIFTRNIVKRSSYVYQSVPLLNDTFLTRYFTSNQYQSYSLESVIYLKSLMLMSSQFDIKDFYTLCRTDPAIIEFAIVKSNTVDEMLYGLFEIRAKQTNLQSKESISFKQDSTSPISSQTDSESLRFHFLDKLLKISQSNLDRSTLNAALYDKNISEDLKHMDIDIEVFKPVLNQIFSTTSIQKLLLLLEWLIFSQTIFNSDTILFGSASILEHIQNIKRIRAILPDIDYYKAILGDSDAVIQSLNTSNIFLAEKILTKCGIFVKLTSTSEFFALFLVKKLTNCDFSQFDSSLFDDIWEQLSPVDVQNTITKILDLNTLKSASSSVCTQYLSMILTKMSHKHVGFDFSPTTMTLHRYLSLDSKINDLSAHASSVYERSAINALKSTSNDDEIMFQPLLICLYQKNVSDLFIKKYFKLLLTHGTTDVNILCNFLQYAINRMTFVSVKEDEISNFYANIFYLFNEQKYQVESILFTHLECIIKTEDHCFEDNFLSQIIHASSCSNDLYFLYLFYQTKISISYFSLQVDVTIENVKSTKFMRDIIKQLISICRFPSHLSAIASLVKVSAQKHSTENDSLKEFLYICLHKFDHPSLIVDVFKSIHSYLTTIDSMYFTQLYTDLWSKSYFYEAISISLSTSLCDLNNIMIFDLSNIKDRDLLEKITADPYVVERLVTLKLVPQIYNLNDNVIYKRILEYAIKNKNHAFNIHGSMIYNIVLQLEERGYTNEASRLNSLDSNQNILTSMVGNIFKNLT